jgi:hypothetical protein
MDILAIDDTQIIGDEDWRLSDRRANSARAASLVEHHPEILEDFPAAQLVRLAGPFGGQFGLISKRTDLLEYYVQYEVGAFPALGRCATQIKLWRSRTATVQGLAAKVFDRYLLGSFDTIVSDSRQTTRGRELWEVQMAGHSQTKTVGVLVRDTVATYDRGMDIADWLAQVDGWGRPASFRQMRFFISNLASVTQNG